MFGASLSVVLMFVGLGAVSFLAFAWAVWHGQFDDLDEHALVIFDEDDFRVAREWETAAQRQEREQRYGPPIDPSPGEWGGKF